MDSVRSSAPASGQPAGDATSRTSGGGANAQYTTRTSRSAAAQDPQAQDADGDEAIGSDCVRIGDIVFLHGVDVVGLLFADGFVDESCWIGRHEGAMSDNDHELIMDSLFVVCVRNFHINVEKSRQADARMGNLHDMSYSEALTAKAQMEQLRRAVDEERAANELETRRSLGAVVRYGDGIELQHLRSGKMLSLRRDAVQPHAAGGDQSPEFAGREATFDVVVTDLESENQHFTVHPRFRIQNLSDPLRYGECLALVSSAIPDQYLQANRESFDDAAFGGDSGFYQHDVHTFRDIFSWQMSLYTPYKAEASASIEGGEVVRLLHKEKGLYVATGDADGDDDGHDEGNIYLDDEECGSYSFWRVELEDERAGATVEYGQLVRLRHLLTQKYLCYYRKAGSEYVKLCAQRNSTRGSGTDARLAHTLMKLDPVFVTTGPMKYKCCCHIKLESIGHYLHANGEPAGAGASGGMLGTSAILHREDGFSVLQVPEDKVQMIGRAVSMRQALQRYLNVLALPDVRFVLGQTSYNNEFVLSMLREAAAMCSDDTPDRKTWQDMLRKSQVLSLVTDITVKMKQRLSDKAARELSAAELEVSGKVFDTAHEMLQAAIRGNGDNGSYLALKRAQGDDMSVMELMQEQLLVRSCSTSAAATLLCMLRDNEKVVKNLEDTEKLFFLQHVTDNERMKATFIRMAAALAAVRLGVGVASGGDSRTKGIPENQSLVIEHWFKGRRELLVRTQMSDRGGLEVVLPRVSKPVDLEALADPSNPYHHMLDYYQACLELYAAVCASQSTEGRNMVGGRHGGWMSYECLLSGQTNHKLPVALRIRFVGLMRMLYVERQAQDYMTQRDTTQLLHEIDAAAVALPGPRFELEKAYREYRPLKAAVLQGLSAAVQAAAGGGLDQGLGESGASELHGHAAQLAMQLALLCQELLRLGLFNTTEELSSAVIPTLLQVFDMGSPAAALPATESARPKVGDDKMQDDAPAALADAFGRDTSSHAAATKLVVCNMLDYICDLRLRVRVPKLLALYKAGVSILSTAAKDGAPVSTDDHQVDLLHKLTEKLRTSHADDLTKLLSYLSLSGAGAEGQRLALTLVKMMQSRMQALSHMSMRLLLRERSPKLELFRELSNTQILLDPGAITAYRSCIEYGALLRAAATRLDARERSQLHTALSSCGAMCVASTTSSDHTRVAAENKETVRRAFLHVMVIDLLTHCLDEKGAVLEFPAVEPGNAERLGRLRDRRAAPETGGQDSDAGERQKWWSDTLLRDCIFFIENFCRGSEKNQQLMAPHVGLVLAFAGRGLHATRAAAAIYDGNLKLCRSVDETCIASLVRIMAGVETNKKPLSEGRKQDRRKPHYLTFLRGLCCVRGTPVLQNHHYVLKQLTQRGPLKMTPSRDVKLLAASIGGLEEAHEEALLLFRGETGHRQRLRLLTHYGAQVLKGGYTQGDLARLLSSPDVGDKDKEAELERIVQALAPKVDALVNALDKAGSASGSASGGASLDSSVSALASENESVRLMAYNLQLLSLILVILEDFNPDIALVIRVFLPPTKLKDDVMSAACLPRAKTLCLQIFKSLYLKDEASKPHPLLEEALWDMMAYLVAQLKATSLDSFSRYATKDAYALPEQLCHYWAPLLLAAFRDRRLMNFLTDAHGSLAGALLDRLVDILNECSLHPYDAAILLAVYKAARQRHVSTAAILSDQALDHADNISDAHKMAIDAGHFVLPPQTGGGSAVARASPGAGGSVDQSAGGGSGADGALAEDDVSAQVHASIGLFARAFLDAVDPVRLPEVGQGVDADAGDEEDEDEDAGDGERQELLALCEAFHDKAPFEAKGIFGSGGTGPMVMQAAFNADDALYLVNMICDYPRGELGTAARLQWEGDVILGVKVLRVLARTWRSSVTEEAPPIWLLHGVPRLLVRLLSLRDCGDRVAVSCLELGIEILHGGNTSFQNSLHDIMSQQEGAPDLFAHLQDRLRRGEEEGRMSKRLAFEPRPQRALLEEYLRIGKQRDVHALIVQAAKNDVRVEASHVRLVIRFLHLLCEGHNERLQNFLRHQEGSSRAVDLVSAVASYVDAVTPYINPRIVREVTTAMSALSEFVQNPCRANQMVLVDTRLCACANEILDISADAETSAAHAVVDDAGGGGDHVVMKQEQERERARQMRVGYQRAINELKAATATALLSLLECVNQPYIPERMQASLNFEKLIDNMNGLLKFYNPYLLMKLKDQHESGKIQLHIPMYMLNPFEVSLEVMEEGANQEAEVVAQHFYITLITLASFDKSGRLNRRITPEHIWDLANLRAKVGVIEISRKGLLEKAYFIVPRVCQYLTESSKQKLVQGVNRANLQTQLTDFAESLEPLYDEMRHQEQLTLRPLLNVFRLTSDLREKLFFLNASVINVLILVFYAYECNGSFICGDNEDLISYKVKPGGKQVMTALSILQCMLAITRQWWYVVERGMPLISRGMRQDRLKPPTNRLWAAIVSLPPDQADPTYRHRRIAQVPRSGIARFLPRKIDFVRPVYLLADGTFWVITIMLLANLLALTLDHPGAPLFLLVHLMEIFNHSAILRNVIQSITFRGNQLIQTAILLLVLYYIFGVIGFLTFPEKFRLERPDIMGGRKLDPNNNGARCTSIWKCTLVVLDMGLRKGDLGEALEEIPWQVENTQVPNRNLIFYRMVYTFFFYVMVTTILMNIIFGIIIDTFAELREKKELIDEMITGRCFICGIERFVFDQLSQEGNGFADHIQNDHNMWKYLYFLVYLKERDYQDMSGGESFVFHRTLQLIMDPDTHEVVRDRQSGNELKMAKPTPDLLWYPQRDALKLAGQRASADQELMRKLDFLDSQTSRISATLSSKADEILTIGVNVAKRAREELE